MSHLIRNRRHERRLFRDERGQALVEFALVLPLLLLLVLGMLDFGRALGYQNDQTHLANEAARAAAVNSLPPGTGATIEARIASQAPNELKRNSASEGTVSQAIQVQICFTDPDPAKPGPPQEPYTTAGHGVKATVSAKYRFFKFLGITVEKTISGSSTQRLEQDWGAAPNGQIYDTSGAVRTLCT